MAFTLISKINQLIRTFQPMIESDQLIYQPLRRDKLGLQPIFCRPLRSEHGLIPIAIAQVSSLFRPRRAASDDTSGAL